MDLILKDQLDRVKLSVCPTKLSGQTVSSTYYLPRYPLYKPFLRRRSTFAGEFIGRRFFIAGGKQHYFPAKGLLFVVRRTYLDMASSATWLRYLKTKLNYSLFLVAKTAQSGEFQRGDMGSTFWKNLLHGKMSFLHWIKGEEMSPTIAASGGSLLVRKILNADTTSVFIGDVVVLKDPEDADNLLVRRLAAVEGHEMVSTDDQEEPFVLEDDECWVVADNKSITPKEARDSRVFGPVPLSSICGRVMYLLESRVDHRAVQNSKSGMDEDYPVLTAELDVNEMANNLKS